jgi:hypothetical protein
VRLPVTRGAAVPASERRRRTGYRARNRCRAVARELLTVPEPRVSTAAEARSM